MDALRIKCNKAERDNYREGEKRQRRGKIKRRQACLDSPSGQKVWGVGCPVETQTQTVVSRFDKEQLNLAVFTGASKQNRDENVHMMAFSA